MRPSTLIVGTFNGDIRDQRIKSNQKSECPDHISKKVEICTTLIYIVKLIAFWYTTQRVMIRWGKGVSDPFKVRNGIKQGGLLSPFLFNLYINELSVNLNHSGVGCVAGKTLINHLSYADDMVLVAPSKRALQMLLNLCSIFAFAHDVLYNTEKSVCMICWPRKFLFKFRPVFYLQGVILEYVDVYKYLGVLVNNTLTDDDEISRRMRGIYATGNMVARKFSKCNIPCKIMMFKTFFSSIYACGLWSSYRVASYSKIKVAHNDILRTLLNVQRDDSISALFVQHQVNNLDSVLRTCYYSLMCRVLNSENVIISSLVHSGARTHSRLWHRWGVALGRDMVEHI